MADNRAFFFLLNLIFLLEIGRFSIVGQQIYESPVGLYKAQKCPSCVELLILKQNQQVSKCLYFKLKNLKGLIFFQSSIKKIPNYYFAKKNITKIMLDDVINIPSNLANFKSVNSISIINCNNLDIGNLLNNNFEEVSIGYSSNLKIDKIKTSILNLAHLNNNWVLNQIKIISDKTFLFELNFEKGFTNKLKEGSEIKNINIDFCTDIFINQNFIDKLNLERVEFGNPETKL